MHIVSSYCLHRNIISIIFQELVPISETMVIPFDYHRYIIGKNGAEVRGLMNDHNVNVAIPPTKDKSEDVVITGPRSNVADAIADLKERVGKIEAEFEDRVSVF